MKIGSNNSNQHDGVKIFDLLKAEGLNLEFPDKAVEAGIYTTWEALSQGKIKIFKSLTNLQAEYRIYRRDEKGKIIKEKDHLMDCLRYLVMSGLDRAKSFNEVDKLKNQDANRYQGAGGSNGWMG